MVLISGRPYIGLLKAVARVLGGDYFGAEARLAAAGAGGGAGDGVAELPPAAILSTAYAEMCGWPVPVAGESLRLPLRGRIIAFDVPWTSVRGYTPALSSGHGRRFVLWFTGNRHGRLHSLSLSSLWCNRAQTHMGPGFTLWRV